MIGVDFKNIEIEFLVVLYIVTYNRVYSYFVVLHLFLIGNKLNVFTLFVTYNFIMSNDLFKQEADSAYKNIHTSVYKYIHCHHT